MIKTKFALPDFEHYMLTAKDRDSVLLQNWIYVEYVRNSPRFDRKRMNMRIAEEKQELENRFFRKGALK